MSHTESKSRVERAIGKFGSSGTQKDEAYAVLLENGHQVLGDYLKGRVMSTDAEDIIQNIFFRVHQNWERLRYDSVSAWYGYLFEAAKNSIHDLARRHKPQETYIEPTDTRVDAFGLVSRVFEGETVYRIADEVWLGCKPSHASKRFLAAQLHFIEEIEIDEVAKIVSLEIETQKLLSWLSDTWVLRKIAFNQLYVSNTDLTALILGVESGAKIDFERIGVLAKVSPPDSIAIGHWKWREVDFILLRYLAGIPFTAALAKTKSPTSKEEGILIDDRSRECFPFVKRMSKLWNLLSDIPQRNVALTKNSLWKRLAFQYHVGDELPQNDILERISPPARIASYPINTVAMWIAKRLDEDIDKWLKGGKPNTDD